MARTQLFVATAIPLLLIGCVSVAPLATAPPSVPPSFGITTPAPATASPALTAAPTATPTMAPTPTPTPTPAPTTPVTPTEPPSTAPPPTRTPGPVGPIDFGATTLIFADDFSDPASGWGTGDTEGGTVAYDGGTLNFDTVREDAWMWSRRTVGAFSNVVRIEAVMVPSAAGLLGLLCAGSDEELFGAVVNTEGSWIFLKLTDAGVTVLTSDLAAGWDVPAGLSANVALDCAGTATGPMRMQISLPDQGVAALYEDPVGAVNFDRVGAYAEANAHPFRLAVDNVTTYGGAEYTGGDNSPAAQALLEHVPEAWREACFESVPSAFGAGGLAALSCPLSDVGGQSNIADYVQFDSQANMDAAYQARVDSWAVESTGSCQTGSNEAPYTIAGATAGRILCAPQTVGVRFDWTFDAGLILSTLTDFDGSYGEAYADWLIAGPE